MTKLDPIIAVKDVNATAAWYERIFLFKRDHTMADPNIPTGNGLILYFRTNDMNQIYKNAVEAGSVIEKDIHLNTNSLRQEFSLRDPDGYFLTVTEFHLYEG